MVGFGVTLKLVQNLRTVWRERSGDGHRDANLWHVMVK